jgi:chemotaxis protein methyltransferase CheR
MIYFSEDTRRQVVGRVIQTLRPAGHLCVGHAESLINLTDAVRVVAPAIYRKST